MNIGWAFRSAALRYPEWCGLDDGRRSLTYGEWYLRVARIAGWLRARGVGRGDRVALAMRQSEQVASAYLAIQVAGAVAVPISFRFGARELGHCLRDSGARLLLVDDAVREALDRVDDRRRLVEAVQRLTYGVIDQQ